MNTMGLMVGRVALVTGGSSGIGKAAVLKLAEAGAKVGVLALNEQEIRTVCDEVTAITGDDSAALPLVADVSSEHALEAAYKKLILAYGRLDTVFANAGINGVWGPLDEFTLEEWNKTITVNLTGTFLTVKCALPYLKKQGGSVIVTSSVNGTRMFSNTGASAYSASKAGQVAFAKMIAVELAQDKIRVNVICPGYIESNIHDKTVRRDLEEIQVPVEFPEGPIPLTGKEPGKASQVGDLVLFLASDMASHITGTEVWIDGGQSLVQG